MSGFTKADTYQRYRNGELKERLPILPFMKQTGEASSGAATREIYSCVKLDDEDLWSANAHFE